GRAQLASPAADRTGGKDFLNHVVVMIDGDVEVLSVKWNSPGCATKFTRPLEPNRALLARCRFSLSQTPRRGLVLRFGANRHRLCNRLNNRCRRDHCRCLSLCFSLHGSKHLIFTRAIAVITNRFATQLAGQSIEMVD